MTDNMGNELNHSQALVAVQERTVEFYGDSIVAVLIEEANREEVYIPLRPIAEHLGLDWSAQVRRTKRDMVLSEATRTVRFQHPGAGNPNVLALPLRLLPGWLFGIDASRVRLEIRDKLLRYQRECFDVLWQAWQDELARRRTGATPVPAGDAVLAEVAALGRAITAMAEQQMSYQARTDARLDRAAEVVASLQHRLSHVERRVRPAAAITDDQAAEISAQVKALAQLLTQQDPSKNHYQSVFAELYRRFGVSSYKLTRQEQYPAVLQFLDDWRRSAGG